MPAAFGLGPVGQKLMTNKNARNSIEMIFSGRPHFPSTNFEGSMGSLRRRLAMMHPIDTMYELSKAATDMLLMMLKAMVLPMLMRERRQETTKEKRMAGRGTSQRGGTWEGKQSQRYCYFLRLMRGCKRQRGAEGTHICQPL